MTIEMMGKPGDSFEFDNGFEVFELHGPIPLLRAYHAETLTTFTFVQRPDVRRLELIRLQVWKNWREACRDVVRRGIPVGVHCVTMGVTRAVRDGQYLELSPVDALSACYMCRVACPDWGQVRYAQWLRRLFADAGSDFDEAMRTVWAAIHDPDQDNPERGARIRTVLAEYPADVAGYRAVTAR